MLRFIKCLLKSKKDGNSFLTKNYMNIIEYNPSTSMYSHRCDRSTFKIKITEKQKYEIYNEFYKCVNRLRNPEI